MSSSNTSPAPWFADTGRNAVYDKRVWFDESGARFGDTPNLVVRIEGGRQADVHLIAAAPELLDALRWYEAQAKNMGKAAIHSDSKTILSIMHEVAVDYGKRARAAITKATGE